MAIPFLNARMPSADAAAVALQWPPPPRLQVMALSLISSPLLPFIDNFNCRDFDFECAENWSSSIKQVFVEDLIKVFV